MKILFTLITLLFAITVQATPAVGDYSNFDLSLVYSNTNIVGSYEIALNSQRSDGQYVMSTVLTISGQPAQRNESVVPAGDLLTDATIHAILGDCASYGGQTTQVTVPAGTFTTCGLPIEGGTVWVAAGVPFGIVKQFQKQSDGSDLTLDLKNFNNGK